ncbi:MAG: oxidoreductase [Deinococcus sp.]|nr:oxidoreductase [Deinococcus sp.]
MTNTPETAGQGLRWGILGAARIARSLIPAIREAGGEVTFLGVREPNSERAKAFAAQWNIPAVGSYADAIASDVDAIYNPLPNDLHLPLTRDTLRAGKHALTEKPFTLNAAEAAELEREAQAAGRVLLEAFAYRFQPHVVRIQELVRSGAVGEVRSYRAAFGFPLNNPDDFRWDASKGGGALFDVGTYAVNLMRLLLGEPQAVSARARWTEGGAESGVDVGLSAVADYPQALASIDCAFDWGSAATQRLTVIGTQGTLEMSGVFHSYTDGPSTLTLTTAAGSAPETFGPFNAYAGMVAHFQRVALGQEAALYPPSDAVAHARVLDALYASARTGERVEIHGS